MGGKVLEYEAKTILQRGIQEGIQQGLQQGLQAGKLTKAKEIAKNLQTLGMDDETIAKTIDEEIALVRQWLSEE